MRKMLFTVLAMLVYATALADQKQPQTDQTGDQAQKFQQYKQRMLEHMDKKIAELQKARGCVAQAQDKNALKGCRPEHEHEGDRDRDHHDRESGKSDR